MNSTVIASPGTVDPIAKRSVLPMWKRSIDLAVCLAASPVLIPIVFVMIVVARLYAPGPIFFRQERVGYLGRKFTMFKFRTMKVNSDSKEHRVHIQAMIRAGKPLEKMDSKGDSRLIPFGRLLRATGLDELPQIINILRGEMTVVGPRPCVPYEAELFTPQQRQRFGAVPGITGLWQVSGKNELTLQQMIELDVRYARTLSLRNDFAIMFRTVPTIAKLVAEAVGCKAGRNPSPGKPSEPQRDGRITSKRAVGAHVIARDARRQMAQFRIPTSLEACPTVSTSATTRDHVA